jgi:flagellin-like hook-associated protein FlgL
MASNEVQLAAGTRSNLLLLQKTTASLERTQLRLATGNKINSALEGPASFFAAKGLNQRAGDLNGLKDGIGQAISTIKSADTGITNIEKLVEQARGLTTQALGSLGTDASSVSLRESLSNQFNTLLRQIDRLAADSGYQGKNLLLGSGLSIDATASSKASVNALAGMVARAQPMSSRRTTTTLALRATVPFRVRAMTLPAPSLTAASRTLRSAALLRPPVPTMIRLRSSCPAVRARTRPLP